MKNFGCDKQSTIVFDDDKRTINEMKSLKIQCH